MIKKLLHHKTSVVFLIVISMALLVLLFNVPKKTDFQRETRNISFILRNDKISDWENMKQGALQAGEDMNASIHFVSLQYTSLDEQIKTMKEEINSCEALVLSPFGSSEDFDQVLNKIHQPVIYAESYTKLTNDYIGPDHKEIGKALANEILRHGNYRKRILVYITKFGNESTTACIEGFREVMDASNNETNFIALDDVSWDAVYNTNMQTSSDVVVSLERTISDAVVEGTKKSNEELGSMTELYTIGNSPQIIKYLENEDIVSTVAFDDFTIGYTSVKAALQKLENKMVQHPLIRFMIIDKEHMYQEDREKLLFPFVR